MIPFSRRQSLALLSGISLSSISSLSFAEGVKDRKFIFVILRGAMDGLSALIPSDPVIEALRGNILPALDERLDLGNGFSLHPSFQTLKQFYNQGDAAFIHASSTPHRNRSHFEAQDALETLAPLGTKEGWLNRVLQVNGASGLAVGRAVPLALKGAAPATNWSPPLFETASDDLLERLSDLYAGDPLLAPTLAKARENKGMNMDFTKRDSRRFSREYAIALSSIGRLMSDTSGPNIGMVALDGWDTHANQKLNLSRKFKALDDGLGALKASLDRDWAKTCVVICSEFGRTVAENGTAGTDHGTGGLTVLLGGAVKGGKVHGEWPGLKQQNLYEGRDLFPANDITAILKGILRDHLGLESSRLSNTVFPNSSRAFDNLIAPSLK